SVIIARATMAASSVSVAGCCGLGLLLASFSIGGLLCTLVDSVFSRIRPCICPVNNGNRPCCCQLTQEIAPGLSFSFWRSHGALKADHRATRSVGPQVACLIAVVAFHHRPPVLVGQSNLLP